MKRLLNGVLKLQATIEAQSNGTLRKKVIHEQNP